MRASIVAVSLSLVLVACPAHHQKPQSGEFETAEELLQALGRVRFSTLRVRGTVDMRKGSKRVKAHMVYLIKRPAWLRFETESFFDQPLSILVSDGVRFSAWDMKEGRFVQGQATPANISQIIPVPMDGPEVSGILTGQPPLIPYTQSNLDWNSKRGAYQLELSNARLRQIIYVHPSQLIATEIHTWRNGKTLYKLWFEDWTQIDHKPVMPTKIKFEMPAQKIKLRIKIKKAQTEPDLDDAIFRLTPPEGIEIEIWD